MTKGGGNTSFRNGEYESINYVYNFGHDIEVMHAINVKHIRQIRTIEDSSRHNAYDKCFKAQSESKMEEESSITVIPIEKEIDLVL